jgi:hypothetical protein
VSETGECDPPPDQAGATIIGNNGTKIIKADGVTKSLTANGTKELPVPANLLNRTVD